MSLDDLYRQVILEHYKKPRNRGELPGANVSVLGSNPSCGDSLRVEMILAGDAVEDIRFTGQGCAISQASASMMTELVKGRGSEEALRMVAEFKKMMRSEQYDEALLEGLEPLQGVRKFAARVKCATLAWTTLEQGITEKGGEVVIDDPGVDADAARRSGPA
jgi:nitrogen fixation NifU-like protein